MAKGLGKGLGALLGDFAPPAPSSGGIRQVPIQRVEPNPNQPRSQFDGEALQALADSIAVHGIIQPLSVREMPGEYYQIIAGGVHLHMDERELVADAAKRIFSEKGFAEVLHFPKLLKRMRSSP